MQRPSLHQCCQRQWFIVEYTLLILFMLFGRCGEGWFTVSRYSEQHMIVLGILDTILTTIFGSVYAVKSGWQDTKAKAR